MPSCQGKATAHQNPALSAAGAGVSVHGISAIHGDGFVLGGLEQERAECMVQFDLHWPSLAWGYFVCDQVDLAMETTPLG